MQLSLQYLQRTKARFLINYERDIYDFLWFGLEAGVRTPFNFSLSESIRTRRDPIIRNQLGTALLLNASVFMVPPGAFCRKKIRSSGQGPEKDKGQPVADCSVTGLLKISARRLLFRCPKADLFSRNHFAEPV